MPIRNTSEDFETWRIRHQPDKCPRKIKGPMSSYELRSPEEVATILGMTRQRVDQIEKSALAKLRKGLQKHYEDFYGQERS